jgi:hypothetical protein
VVETWVGWIGWIELEAMLDVVAVAIVVAVSLGLLERQFLCSW